MSSSCRLWRRFSSFSSINKYCKCNRSSLFTLKLQNYSNSSSDNQLNLLINTEPRRFNNLRFDLSTQNDDKFEEELDFSLSHWKSNEIRGVWAYTPSHKSHLIPILLQRGFDFHSAGPGYVLLSKWIVTDEPNKLPHGPTSQIGVAGIVMNDNDEILVVQENRSWVERKWKFPGGLAENQENIDIAVCREIYEETGIECDFKSILGFRHQHGVTLGGSHTKISDFYVVCRLIAKNVDINRCQSEIHDAKWMKLKEFLEIDTWPINKEFAQILHKNIEIYKHENNTNNEGNVNNMKLLCDWTIKEIQSVSVPGSTYKLFIPQ